MTREEIEKMMKEELGKLDDDDQEVAEASARFDETSHKISLLI